MSSNTLSNIGSLRQRLSRFTAPFVVLALSTAGLVGIAGVVATEGPASATVSAGGFVGVTPNRLLDTREIGQQPCVSNTRNLTVTGGATTIPTGASAVALNVTVVSPSAAGYLTVFPAGATRPTASNLNYSTGEVVPNGVYVKVGTSNQISIYASGGCPNVIVDVLGYFEGTTPVAAGGFVGVTPNRLLDTREPGQQPCVTGTRTLIVTGGDTKVPAGATAVSLNVTVVSPLTPGYVTVYPNGASRPTASNVNYTTGQVVPNNVTVKVGPYGFGYGAIMIYASGGCPNVIVDVVGYYEGGEQVLEGGFVGVTPNRLVDTRNIADGPCVSGVRNLTVAGSSTPVPEGVNAVALNITVVTPSTSGYLTVFPTGSPRPTASTLNYVAGGVVPNGTVVKVGVDSSISLYSSGGCPHLIVDVVGYYQGLPALPTAIAAGGSHTCALLANRTIRCWGRGSTGQLGNGKSVDSAIPVSVLDIATATTVTAGLSHSCALLVNRTIRCWGANDKGQLGNGTNIDSAIPVSVIGISDAISIAAGSRHTCALLADGGIKCWGDNYTGQLNNGTSIDSNIPVAVRGWDPVVVIYITNAIAITAGNDDSCALLVDHTIRCWGFNLNGQLGNGTFTNTFKALLVTGIDSAAAVTAGGGPACALFAEGTVKCWGWNYYGQLGDGTNNDSSIPVAVGGISNAGAISAGPVAACALATDRTIKCWGYNSSGQLGDGTNNDSNIPVAVVGISNASAISVGYDHTCALLTEGTVKCWGYNGLTGVQSGGSNVPVSVIGV